LEPLADKAVECIPKFQQTVTARVNSILILVIANSTTTFATKTELYLGTGQFKGKGHIFLFISCKMRRVAGLMGYNAVYIT
jgi:hypothetical protein